MTDAESRHPEARTMVAFLEGRLAADELASVAGHMRDCARCRLVVSETARFEREEDDNEVRPAATRWQWLAAAAAIAAIAVTGILVSRDADPIEHMAEHAPRAHRRVEGRLSGFAWAELRPPARGTASTADPADLKLSGAAGEVLEKTAGDAAPASRHASGVAYLLTDQRSQAARVLEEAARGSSDARVWSDLAAARLALVLRDGQTAQLPLALAAADRALALDPKSPEARFNRALILEQLGVREQARKAWQAFLEVDAGSGWSVEARAHLQRLGTSGARFAPRLFETEPAAALVARFPEDARRRGEGPLLAEWADAFVANDRARAAQRLDRARALGDALAARSGERMLRDAVAAIDGAAAGQRRMLADAHRVYRDGRIDLNEGRVVESERKLRDAAERFRRAGSPMAHVAASYAASAAFNRERGAVLDEVLALQAALDRGRYRALGAELQWTLALNGNQTGDWDTAIREGEAAAKTFRELGEVANAATLDSVVAYAHDFTGADDLAWSRRIGAIGALCSAGDGQRCAAVLRAAATTLTASGRAAEAAALLDASVAGSAEIRPADRARTLIDRARAARMAGDGDAVQRTLGEARQVARLIADPAARAIEETQIEIVAAAVNGAPPAAFDRAIAFYSERAMPRLVIDALIERARAHRRAGDGAAALTDYEAALRTIEEQQAAVADPTQRSLFLDVAARAIEESIELQLERGSAEAAFALAARRHGRAGPSRLPRGLAAIEYVVLPERLIVFAVSSEGVTARTVAITRNALASRVERFATALRGRGDVQREAAELFALLVAPVRARLAAAEELVIVPDRQLHAVPFGGLFDGERQRFLIEDFAIRYAPAVRAEALDAAVPLSPAVVVADPPAAGKPRLAASRAEAAHIAELHGALLLAGDEATRPRFAAAAARSALIHYSGHAESDPGTAFGALLLAGDGGILGSSDIARLSLPLEPLVVLGACGTLRGDAMHVAGMSSIAHAFLFAGARGVVGTLWEVDDDVAAALFSRFHQNLRAGASPARALRAAQVDMLRSGDPRLRHAGSWAVAGLLSNS